jgi:hypothetical protein
MATDLIPYQLNAILGYPPVPCLSAAKCTFDKFFTSFPPIHLNPIWIAVLSPLSYRSFRKPCDPLRRYFQKSEMPLPASKPISSSSPLPITVCYMAGLALIYPMADSSWRCNVQPLHVHIWAQLQPDILLNQTRQPPSP